MAINQENGPAVIIDIDSSICQSILKGACMDVIEIDGASNNSVDQVRELCEDCRYAPTQCRYKIYIIDEVHMLSTAAFNALLKTLEEPPVHVKFFFATTEIHKVLPTIVSRCQRFEFRPISPSVIAEKLKIITDIEKVTIAQDALSVIGRLANGSMRDAQSILDQLISFCGKKISEADILDVYGLIPQATLKTLMMAIAKGDFKGVMEVSSQLISQGRDLCRILQDLQEQVHEVLMDAILNGGKTEALGQNMTQESLMRLLDVLQNGESSLKMGLSAQMNFEVTLFKAIEQSRSRAIDTLLKELTSVATNLPQAETVKKK